MIKHDDGKPNPFSVLSQFPHALEAVVKRGDDAIEKYGTYSNWRTVNADRYKNALMRHQLAIWKGEHRDEETGQLHYAAVAWNALAILELEIQAEYNLKQMFFDFID
jgi:hypothetical protein